MALIHFDPLDTLFFRDGRPYNQGEQNQAGVHSLFPPAPSTLVGAIRAACARHLGWEGGNWSPAVSERLGDQDDLGPLRFQGPVLMRKGECLFPAPAHLIGVRSGDQSSTLESMTLLSPSCEAFHCDLGAGVPLPIAENPPKGAKPLGEAGWWITASGLASVLAGERPAGECLKPREKLWTQEPRVGICRSGATRTTEADALYSPSHVRLQPDITLSMQSYGLPHECLKALPTRPQPVGGEARSAWLRVEAGKEGPFPRLEPPGLHSTTGKTLRYTAVVLTPADTGAPPLPEARDYGGLPGRVLSACLPRPVHIGGWDSVRCEPRPLRPHLAPGSVLFMEAAAEDASTLRSLHGGAIGVRTEWGYGQIAIGRFPLHPDPTKEQSK